MTNLWDIAQALAQEETPPRERTLLFIGDHKAGKTSLLNSFLRHTREEAPKPTVALEYTPARAPATLSESRDLCHVYELGGGRLLSSLVSIPLDADHLPGMMVVITLDLSHPHRVLDSLLFWFQVASNRLSEVLGTMNQRNSDKFLMRTQKKWANHEDSAKVSPFIVPVIVVASKYDLFCNQESENRKWMGRTLRYFCHKHGASLMYWSASETQLAAGVRNLLAQFAFGEPGRKFEQKDHAYPVQVSSGSDSFAQIGPAPHSKGDASNNSSGWEKAFKHAFPKH